MLEVIANMRPGSNANPNPSYQIQELVLIQINKSVLSEGRAFKALQRDKSGPDENKRKKASAKENKIEERAVRES
jgi:hypothetical protein